MPVHAPGPRLYDSIPLKFLGGRHQERKTVMASLNLTSFVDTMTVLVIFLLMTFSATGDILMSQKGLQLPDAINQEQLKRAPIITVTEDSITFNGQPVADTRTLEADTSMEWKIIQLYEQLKTEHTKFELTQGTEEEKAKLRGLLILQADKSVDTKILNRVMKTAYAAEYPNIMFAVNRRSK